MGSLVFQATLGGQVNLNGPNTASTFDIAVPATTGTMVTTGDTGTVTNTMLAGSIANAKLTNSSVTVGSTSIALGATSTTLDGVNIGATTAGTGAFTTLSASSTVSGTGFSTYLASPPAIGGTTAAAGAFTTLSASSTVSGTGFSTYLASPPAIGGTAAAAGTFTTLSGTTSVTTPIVKSASSLTLQTNGTTTAVTIDTSQKVGIGTTSPSYKLNVGSTDNVPSLTGAGITLFSNSNLTSNIGGVLNFRTGLGQTASDIFNLSICAYDHSGDGNADGLSINGADGVSFSTGGNSRSERVRIDGSGNVLVGNTTSGYGPLRGVNILNQDVGAIIIGHTSGTSSGNGYINFNYNGSAIGSISQNGTTAVSYNTSSDYRLKENITPLTGALAKVAALKPCTYTWKSAPDEVGEGFIAHELAEVCPQAVHGTKDAVDADGNPVYQGIDTSFLVATLTAAIQELTARVDALEAK